MCINKWSWKTIRRNISRGFLPQNIVLISVAASAAVFGWVAPVTNRFLDPESDVHLTPTQLSWMIVTPEIGDLLVSKHADEMADKWGRKSLILVSGPMLAIGWVLIMFARSFTEICLMRFVQGIAIGIVFSTGPKYVREISRPPPDPITCLFPSAWFLGFLTACCIGPFVSYAVFTSLTALVPVFFTILFSHQPESPYYLVMTGKSVEAAASLAMLRAGSTEKEIEREFEEIKKSVEESMDVTSPTSDCTADRRALVGLVVIQCIRIASDFFVLMSHSTNFLARKSSTSFSPDLVAMATVFCLLWGGFINTPISEVLGKRPFIFISTFGWFFCTFIITIYLFCQFKLSSRVFIYGWIVLLAIISYYIFSIVGIFPVSMTCTPERITNRSQSVNINSILIPVASFICIKTYQLIGIKYNFATGVLLLAATLVAAFLIFYMFAPEENRQRLLQMQKNLTNLINKKEETVLNRTNYVTHV